MSTVIVWFLVAVQSGHGYPSPRPPVVSYSPALATLEDCKRFQRHVQQAAHTQCIQVSIPKDAAK